jgi:hypothetical protein
MADDTPFSEEHLRRLTLAARAAELATTSPQPDTSPIREGTAGEVPLRLFLCEDGTLEVRAMTPQPLPEGFEARRDATEGPRVQAVNPATARRLWAHPEVRRRLEALFEAAPRARIFENAVRLELAPEVKDEQIQGALRAALRAASTLAQASEELTRAADQNRELVRSTASPELLEGGRRFIKLLPEKRRLDKHQRTRVLLTAEQMFLRGELHLRVRDYLSKETSTPEEAEELFLAAIRNSEAGVLKRKLVTLLIVIPILGLSVWGLARYGFFTGRRDTRLFVFITSLVAVTYAVWKLVGRFFDRREARQAEDGLYRSIYTQKKD